MLGQHEETKILGRSSSSIRSYSFFTIVALSLINILRCRRIVYTYPGITGSKRRRNAGINLPLLQQHLYFLQIAGYDFRILRTDREASPAQYTLFLDDMCLPRREPYGFHRTVSDALMAVFAVCFLQSQYFSHTFFLCFPLLSNLPNIYS